MAPMDPHAKRKRKRRSEGHTDIKRSKASLPEPETDPAGLEGIIDSLEAEILDSQKNYNKINELLQYADKSKDSKIQRKASLALCTIFSHFLSVGKFSPNDDDQANIINRWLAKRYEQYCSMLLQALPQDFQFVSGLLLELVKQETSTSSAIQLWKDGLYPKVVKSILNSDGLSLETFAKEHILPFKDTKTHACRVISSLSELSSTTIDQIIYFLPTIPLPDPENESADLCLAAPSSNPKRKPPSDTALKKSVQDAWLSTMRNNLSALQRKQILDLIPDSIAPWFPKPELLTDFLVDSFNTGGALSLTALSGMFYLIQNRNLDYPHFYTKLYSLLDHNILHSKQRSRFLRLMNIFLSSTHLPAALVASFMKRTSRLCLHAPPSAILAIIPWLYNMIQDHRVCALMIHRINNEDQPTNPDSDPESLLGKDPFLAHEPDPMQTNALESSLWEIDTLASHYHPNVATIASIISKPFTKLSYKLDDFLDYTYDGMLEAELSRPLKREPVVEFQIPKRVFVRGDEESDVPTTTALPLIARLWNEK